MQNMGINNQPDNAFDAPGQLQEPAKASQSINPSNPTGGNANPLMDRKFTRSEKDFVRLPSRGKWGRSPQAKDLAGEIPIYPMTAMDEMTIHNPHGLVNGQAVIKLIQSCTNITNVEDLTYNDVEFLIAAIRKATSGPDYHMASQCTNKITDASGNEVECEQTNEEIINLEALLATGEEMEGGSDVILEFPAHGSSTSSSGGGKGTKGKQTTPATNQVIVSIRPKMYEDMRQFSIEQFNDLSRFNASATMNLTEEEKLEEMNRTMASYARMLVHITVNSISHVTIKSDNPDGGPNDIVVSDPTQIREWIDDLELSQSRKIMAEIEKVAEQGFQHTYDMTCSKCGHKYKARIMFNPSNFF